MNQRKIILFLIFLIGIPCASLAQTEAQTGPTCWANLNRLHVGEKIEIVDSTAKNHDGTLLSVSDSAISYRNSAGEQSVPGQMSEA